MTPEPIPIQKGASRKPQLMGAVKPRIMSPPLKGHSYGDAFAAFCKKYNYELMPWQKFVADDFLTVDAENNFIRKTICILVARQNAKTTLAYWRILFGLFELGERNIVAMSSNRSMALVTFRQVVAIIENNDELRDQVKLNRGVVGRFANGQESIELKNGASYKVVDTVATTYGIFISSLVYLNGSTDYVEIYMNNVTGGGIGVLADSTRTYFSGIMIKAA